MTNRTRLFLMGSATVVMAGLGVGMLAYYGGLSVAADDSVDELAYVPADATMVAFADVQAIMNSELRKHVKSLVPTQGRGQDQFKEETGIDLESDVDRVVAASVREAPTAESGAAEPRGSRAARSRESGVAIISGRFDVSRIEGAARQRGATVEEYKGVRVVKSSQPEGRSSAIAFAKPGTVLVGDEAHVKRAIDDRAAGRSVGSNAEMMRRISEAKAGANAWAVGRADGFSLGAASPQGLPGGLSSQLPALEWFAASGHFNGGVSATFRTEARDEQGAKNLRDVIQGVVALGRLQAGQRPEIDALLSSLQLGGGGKTVTLSFAVPGELLEKLSSQSSRTVAP